MRKTKIEALKFEKLRKFIFLTTQKITDQKKYTKNTLWNFIETLVENIGKPEDFQNEVKNCKIMALANAVRLCGLKEYIQVSLRLGK